MNRILLLIAGLALAFAPAAARADFSPPSLDKPLDLKFTAVDGRPVDFAQMRGKVVLLDFWATWCPGCRAEVPNVVDTYKKFHDQGLEIVGISLDQDKDSLLAFTQQNGMNWPQYFDGQGWGNAISSTYGIDAVPAMFVIGKDGRIVKPDGSDLNTLIARLVKEPAPQEPVAQAK
ncbi:MAG: TlpA disulfide reductase family protein [Verrucomicrobiota bacterium]